MPRWHPISMHWVFPVFIAKPISLQVFNNTSAFLSIDLITSPNRFTSSALMFAYGVTFIENDPKCKHYRKILYNFLKIEEKRGKYKRKGGNE